MTAGAAVAGPPPRSRPGVLCPSCFADKRSTSACAVCGFDELPPRESRFLPYRHRLQRGRYTVGVVLGNPGGFGVAYKAYDAKQSAIVVIKECLLTESGQVAREHGDPQLHVSDAFRADHRKWVERFLFEGRLIQRFRHPCIVRVIDVFEENGTACYVMPFVEGEDLVHHCTAHGGTLPEGEVLRIAQQLLAALVEVHGSGFVHRDIKPSNVLITRNRRKPVLIDFGAARDSFDDERSRSHMAMHTRSYAPLEQVQMSPRQGPWTDIYSLCATLHYALLHQPPVEAAMRKGAVPDPFVPIHTRLPKLGSRLATVIDNGLALEPERRLQSAAAALRLLGVEAPTAVARKQGEEEGRKERARALTAPPVPDLPAPPPPPPPPPPPMPAWLGLTPAGVVLAAGTVSDEPFTSYVTGLPGWLIAANAVGWGWWRVRSRSMRSAQVTAVPAGTGTGPGIGPVTGTSGGPGTSGPSVLEAGPAMVAAIELHLHADGAAPVIRTLRAGQTLVIGRTARSDLAIGNDLLSGRHAAITAGDDGSFSLQDLGSLNHVYMYRRGNAGEAGAWSEVRSASGRKGRFVLGPPDGGVRLDIRQTTVPR